MNYPPNPLEKPLRWAQLTLTEDDPLDFDLDFWLGYIRRTHSQGACLSAGGYMAYYPTHIPLHHRSAWLGESDPFGALVQGCKQMGMAILARTDPHAIHADAAQAHPEWIAMSADGQPRRHWSFPEVWVTCALGDYNFEFMTEVHREIVSRYPVDGIFSNRWSGHGICHCDFCRRTFKAATGFELPTREAQSDPAWQAYQVWREDRLFALIERWDSAIRQVNPAARYIPNSGGGAFSDLDMLRLSQVTSLLVADRQARSGIQPLWANGKNAKEFRGAYGSKPVCGLFSVGLEDRARWKDSVQSPAELRLWMAGAAANGMRPWFTKFCGKVFDDRWLEPVAEFFDWHWQNERYLRNTAPLARVGVVYSQQTAQHYGGAQAHSWIDGSANGVYQALVEARIPFEMLLDRLLDAEHLAAFKTLVLPDIACLSETQCAQLRQFVQTGGGLVATWETSLYDEHGNLRQNFGLADLFGVDCAGPLEGPLKNTYLNLEHAAPDSAVCLAGLQDAQRVIHGEYRLPIQPRPGLLPPPLTLVPPYPDLPMEEVYPRQARTDIPGAALHQFGGGRVVYFPSNIERCFWETLNPDLGKLIANAVVWASGGRLQDASVVEVDGAGLLEVTTWRQAESITVHLVNLTNPMLMRGAVREIYPVGPFQVSLRLPEGVTPKGARLLKAGVELPLRVERGVLTVDVPRVEDHEVVAVDV